MKKITYCILILTSYLSFCQTQQIDIKDFKVNEPAGQGFSSGTRFDFEFKIKGDYSYSSNGYHQIDIYIYKGNSTSSSNELGRIYWNREDDYDIIYPTYGTKTTWLTSLKSYSTNPGQQFTMRVTYGNHEETYLYTYPGPTIPDIDLVEAIIEHDGQSWDVLDHEKPTINANFSGYGNPTTTFNFTLKNFGGMAYGMRDPQITIYLSDKTVLGTGYIQLHHVYDSQITPIPSNEEDYINFDRQFSASLSTPNGFFTLLDEKTYYFHFLIKVDYEPTLLYQSKNHYVFPFKVNRLDVSSKTSNPYMVDVYDITGTKITSKMINNSEEESLLINQLPSKLYIIKSEGETKKVIYNNN